MNFAWTNWNAMVYEVRYCILTPGGCLYWSRKIGGIPLPYAKSGVLSNTGGKHITIAGNYRTPPWYDSCHPTYLPPKLQS